MMKVVLEVLYDPDRRGLIVVIPRAQLLEWVTEAFELKPPPIPEVVKPTPAMTLADLHLSNRTLRCLEAANVRSVEHLTRLFETDLLKMEGLGRVCLAEVKAALKKDGLRLGMRG